MVNNLFKIVKLLPRAKALPVKWVFIYKFDKNNVLFRQKARLILYSNKQRLGINYGYYGRFKYNVTTTWRGVAGSQLVDTGTVQDGSGGTM